MSETVAAVVVTYNRKELLIECLEALRNQTYKPDAIFIIDNKSDDGTPALLLEKNYISKLPGKDINENQLIQNHVSSLNTPTEKIAINYVRKFKNDGGSGGFHEGMKQAYEAGYDWLWLMDDDVRANYSALEKLLMVKEQAKVLVPIRIDLNGNICETATLAYKKKSFIKKLYEFDFGSFKSPIGVKKVLDKSGYILLENFAFEGPLIHRIVIDKIGLCVKNFFIFYDDTEYALRIIKNKVTPILLVPNATIVRLLFNNETEIPSWKHYYGVRNGLVITRKYYPLNFFLFTINQLRLSINSPKKILVFFKALFDSFSIDLLIK